MSEMAHPEHLRARRRRWFSKGPLPKDVTVQYPYTLWAVQGDADKLVVITGGDRQSNYAAGKMMFYTFATIVGVMSVAGAFMKAPFVEMLVLLLPLALFCWLGWYFGRKEKTCDGGPYLTFDRANGLVHIDPILWKPARTFRFRDLEAFFVSGGPSKFGTGRYFVNVFPYDEQTNKPGKGFGLMCGPVGNFQDAVALWSLLCQYMDRSRPLPNLPVLWEALLEGLGWEDEADRQHKFDQIAHAYAVNMRRLGVTQDLGVDPHLDPRSNLYAGPRSRAHYAAQLAAARGA